MKKAHDLGLEVLLEIHSSEELTYINEKIDMVGINNRNLGTFFTDVETLFGWPDNFPKMQYWYPKAESPTRKL